MKTMVPSHKVGEKDKEYVDWKRKKRTAKLYDISLKVIIPSLILGTSAILYIHIFFGLWHNRIPTLRNDALNVGKPDNNFLALFADCSKGQFISWQDSKVSVKPATITPKDFKLYTMGCELLRRTTGDGIRKADSRTEEKITIKSPCAKKPNLISGRRLSKLQKVDAESTTKTSMSEKVHHLTVRNALQKLLQNLKISEDGKPNSEEVFNHNTPTAHALDMQALFQQLSKNIVQPNSEEVIIDEAPADPNFDIQDLFKQLPGVGSVSNVQGGRFLGSLLRITQLLDQLSKIHKKIRNGNNKEVKSNSEEVLNEASTAGNLEFQNLSQQLSKITDKIEKIESKIPEKTINSEDILYTTNSFEKVTTETPDWKTMIKNHEKFSKIKDLIRELTMKNSQKGKRDFNSGGIFNEATSTSYIVQKDGNNQGVQNFSQEIPADQLKTFDSDEEMSGKMFNNQQIDSEELKTTLINAKITENSTGNTEELKLSPYILQKLLNDQQEILKNLSDKNFQPTFQTESLTVIDSTKHVPEKTLSNQQLSVKDANATNMGLKVVDNLNLTSNVSESSPSFYRNVIKDHLSKNDSKLYNVNGPVNTTENSKNVGELLIKEEVMNKDDEFNTQQETANFIQFLTNGKPTSFSALQKTNYEVVLSTAGSAVQPVNPSGQLNNTDNIENFSDKMLSNQEINAKEDNTTTFELKHVENASEISNSNKTASPIAMQDGVGEKISKSYKVSDFSLTANNSENTETLEDLPNRSLIKREVAKNEPATKIQLKTLNFTEILNTMEPIPYPALNRTNDQVNISTADPAFQTVKPNNRMNITDRSKHFLRIPVISAGNENMNSTDSRRKNFNPITKEPQVMNADESLAEVVKENYRAPYFNHRIINNDKKEKKGNSPVSIPKISVANNGFLRPTNSVDIWENFNPKNGEDKQETILDKDERLDEAVSESDLTDKFERKIIPNNVANISVTSAGIDSKTSEDTREEYVKPLTKDTQQKNLGESLEEGNRAPKFENEKVTNDKKEILSYYPGDIPISLPDEEIISKSAYTEEFNLTAKKDLHSPILKADGISDEAVNERDVNTKLEPKMKVNSTNFPIFSVGNKSPLHLRNFSGMLNISHVSFKEESDEISDKTESYASSSFVRKITTDGDHVQKLNDSTIRPVVPANNPEISKKSPLHPRNSSGTLAISHVSFKEESDEISDKTENNAPSSFVSKSTLDGGQLQKSNDSTIHPMIPANNPEISNPGTGDIKD